MDIKVKVLYDFPAQPNSSELNIYQNDILTVINKDIGEGWWEGTNEKGERGLFPASYVEPIVDSPQPARSIYQNVPNYCNLDPASPEFFDPLAKPAAPKVLEPVQPATSTRHDELDWPDEDWDEDDDSGDNANDFHQQRNYPAGTPFFPAQQTANNPILDLQKASNKAARGVDLNVAAANLAITESSRSLAATSGPAKPRKNFNRFSNFVKTGLESFILESKTFSVPHENIVQIQTDPELGIVWKPNLNHYTCQVTTHGKESKMKGFKTYISYDITPSTSNIIVRRRYKHFDWLMQRLEEKFIVTPLPPLPEKQIAGRFQEDFVEHRRLLLQLCVNYITRHPILSQCDVWWHFMTCSTDDMKGWKNGKRKAERDDLVGANFFFSIEVNPKTSALDPVKTTKQLDNFQRFVAKFSESVKHMYTTAVDQSKKISYVYSKDYKKLSESIKELSSAFQSGTAWRNSLGLNEAIRQTSAAYEEISRLHEEEPKHDFEPMADVLHQYKGLLSCWPDILQLHKNTTNRRNEHERLLEDGKISDIDMVRINQRANVITYATLAEINHFHNERLVDFKKMMQVFLTAQINFHNDIVSKLQTALNKINNA